MDNCVNHSRTYISAQSKNANSENMLATLLTVLHVTNVDKDNPATSYPPTSINKTMTLMHNFVGYPRK